MKLLLNKRKYVETILQRFNMQECKLVKVPIPVGVKLYADQCPKTQEEEEDMSHVPYVSVVGISMYAIVYTRPYISRAVGVGYVLYSLHVCVWARQIRQLHLTIPTSFSLCVVCIGKFPEGDPGGL